MYICLVVRLIFPLAIVIVLPWFIHSLIVVTMNILKIFANYCCTRLHRRHHYQLGRTDRNAGNLYCAITPAQQCMTTTYEWWSNSCTKPAVFLVFFRWQQQPKGTYDVVVSWQHWVLREVSSFCLLMCLHRDYRNLTLMFPLQHRLVLAASFG